MKKSGIFNSEISKVVAQMGHKDMVAVVDMGFPISNSVERIDLVVDKGEPSIFRVLEVLNKELMVEEIIFANESSEEFVNKVKSILENTKVTFVSHEELKKLSNQSKAVIRTGEVVPYSNVILVSGVIF
ncbi:MAG: D-ribose pyranase [Thermotogaceae bacterium]|nr:D-ribose pyranase [Thermotogaceae bacterium]